MKLKKLLQESEKLPSYSAVLLDDKSHSLLINTYKEYIEPDWRIYAHHMTIDPFGLVAEEKVGIQVKLTVTDYGISDNAFAVKVTGYSGPTNNKFPHVTIAVNWNEGGKPKDSNLITKWISESRKIELSGTIQNL
jgi:hypothetical protein